MTLMTLFTVTTRETSTSATRIGDAPHHRTFTVRSPYAEEEVTVRGDARDPEIDAVAVHLRTHTSHHYGITADGPHTWTVTIHHP